MAKAAVGQVEIVLSALWEGFPNVLAKTLGVGVPAVSTDCPSSARDILQHDRYGKLVPRGDAAAQNYLPVFGLMEAAGGQ